MRPDVTLYLAVSQNVASTRSLARAQMWLRACRVDDHGILGAYISFLALSARTVEKHRCYGTGPKYRKLDGRAIYGLADLKACRPRHQGINVSSRFGDCICRLSQFSRPDALACRRAPMVSEKADQSSQAAPCD